MNVLTPIGLIATEAAMLPSRAVSLELRELRAFVSVARNGNFGRAARELGASQPTVSHQVQRLEEAVGTELLLRHGRGVTPTGPGAALLERLDAIAHLLELPLPADGAARPMAGTVRVGVPAELAPMLLPAIAEHAAIGWPQLQLELGEYPTGEAEEALLQRRIDVALLQDPPALLPISADPILSEPLGLVAGVRGQLAESSTPLRLRELARLPLILPSEQHWIYRRLSHAAFQHGISLRAKLRVQGLGSLKPMLRSGLGCTVLPLSAVQEEVARGSLVFRRIEQPALTCTHAIAWSDAADAPVAAFAGLVRQAIEELAMRGAWVGADLLSAASAPIPQPWTLPAADAARLEAVPA